MGLFGAQSPPEKRRRVRKTPAERLAAQEADYLSFLKKRNPAKWQQLMDQRVGVPEKEAADPMETFLAMAAKLRKAGILKDPQDIQDNTSFVKEILAAIPAIPLVLQTLQQQQAAAAPQVPAAPATLPAAQEPTPQPQQPQQGQSEPSEAEKMDMLVAYIKSGLSGKSAADAARWLAGQPYPQAQALVRQLAQVPEGEAFDWLLNMCSSQQGLKPLGRWIEQQGELWVRSISRELHAMTGQQAM